MTEDAIRSPLIQAHFRLAKAFGWTPQEVQQLTMAQARMYMDLMRNEE